MTQLKQLLALMALAWFVGVVSARRNLTTYCAELSRSMASNKEVYTNPQVAMNEARAQLRAWSNVGAGSRFKLAKAWKVVVNEEPCDSRSDHHASVIARCKPELYPEMRTLEDAVRKYSIKCFTPNFWDERLKEALKGHLGHEDKSGLTYFINDKFIQQYREDNRGEREVQFDNSGPEPCCRPAQSKRSVLDATQAVLGTSTLERALQVLREDPETLEATMEAYLFNPCHRYLHSTHMLIMRAKDVSKYYEHGCQPLITKHSQLFRDAVFRYRYCLPLLYRGTPCSYRQKKKIYSFFNSDEECSPEEERQVRHG